MSFLLDTNVLSENAVRAPNAKVATWLRSLMVDEAYLSVITLAEIRLGIEVARDAANQRRLEQWLSDIKASFAGRILPIDDEVAETGGRIQGQCQKAGRPAEAADTLIAATAESYGLTLVTRNVKDFEVWGGPVFNPWTDDPPPQSA